jgi:ABC-type phosphate/phosphonate transport system substrate-binding protein
MNTLLRCVILLVFVQFVCTPGAAHADTIRFGVPAPQGSLQALEVWRPLAQYLAGAEGRRVSLVPLGIRNVEMTVERERVDIALVGALQAISLVDRCAYVPVASRVAASGDRFGGVIAASSASGIRTTADLRGKKVAALGAESAGAFLFQVNHLMDRGIDPRMDFAEFKRCSGQAECVQLVKSGRYDACFVRTGVLEALEEQGALSMEEFNVVDAREEPGFEYAHSTELYPAWYLVASRNLDASVRERIRQAAFGMSADDPVAAPTKTLGFVEPRDIGPVRNALQRVFAAGFADLP